MNIKKNQQQKTCSISETEDKEQENRCKFCKRPLRSEDSIKKGYGICCGIKEGVIVIKHRQKIISKDLFEY